GVWVSENVDNNFVNVIAWLAAIVAPIEGIRRLMGDLVVGGPKRLWQRWLAGRPGRFFFKTAGLWQRSPELPAAEPTVMALGRATEMAFDALPAALQRNLAQVPGVVAKLQ